MEDDGMLFENNEDGFVWKRLGNKRNTHYQCIKVFVIYANRFQNKIGPVRMH